MYGCQHAKVVEARCKAVPRKFLKEVPAAASVEGELGGLTEAYWCRGLALNPMVGQQLPAQELVAEAKVDGELLMDDAGLSTLEGLQLHGELFFDGHADLHPLVAARRASWGIAMLDGDGRTKAMVYGVVPGPHPADGAGG